MTEKRTKTFTSERLRKLCANARELGIDVDFHTDSSAKYYIDFKGVSNKSPSCLGACCYVMGMMSMIAVPVSSNRDEIIKHLQKDDHRVSFLVKTLFDHQVHFQQDHQLFNVCVRWINKGNVLTGQYLDKARAALLNRYLDRIIAG